MSSLLGLAPFISLSLRHFSDFLRLQLRSKFIITSLTKIVFFTVAVILTHNLQHAFYLIKPSRDTEENPGPKLNSSQKLSICHQNLNNIAARNFIKVSLLITYNSIHKYNIICLSESILIQVQSLMITVQKFLDTILCAVTILGTLNVEVVVFITNCISL